MAVERQVNLLLARQLGFSCYAIDCIRALSFSHSQIFKQIALFPVFLINTAELEPELKLDDETADKTQPQRPSSLKALISIWRGLRLLSGKMLHTEYEKIYL
jgi:hypothetical protein